MSERIFIWLGAIIFAVGPLIFLVAREKGLDLTIFYDPSKYDGLERDLCFVAIAVLVIGLLDAGENLVSALESDKRTPKEKSKSTVYILIIIVLEISTFAVDLGGAKPANGVSSLLFYLFLSTFVISAACRFQLLRAMR